MTWIQRFDVPTATFLLAPLAIPINSSESPLFVLDSLFPLFRIQVSSHHFQDQDISCHFHSTRRHAWGGDLKGRNSLKLEPSGVILSLHS
ncbi:hypothetical protein EV356DRAFT_64930 [Viridothelium virens]|uniref:Uncharacterized protein n=1 Tax=Viridothelium virens TaxID=1048519 RepID=A0A6A6HF20_VIRVR|nr:hypothetical protein EV356DRAFT_64930 [Viridothelium virens]